MPTTAWKTRNIFEDVLHHEDVLTDALRNFLKYPIVQKSLWRTIGDQVPECVRSSKIEDIQTRPSGGSSRKQPDLVLYGPNFILVVEVKIGAELTDAQKKAYVPWIKGEIDLSRGEGQKGFMIFLVPDDYSHRRELDSCIEKARAKLFRSNESNIQVLDSITWQEFVSEFRWQDMPSQNELIREFYSHLSGRFESVKFTSEEFYSMVSNDTANGIRKLRCIVEKVKSRPELEKFNKSRLNASDYGYDFSSAASKKSVYFGIWHEVWACKGRPLCIAISTDSKMEVTFAADALQGREEKYGDIYSEFEDDGGGNWLVVGFKLPGPGETCGKLIEEIIEDIERLLQKERK